MQSHSSQRRHELEKKREAEAEAARERRAQKRSRAEMEAEEREKGLGTELDASNKGFAMLQKMGYKKGEHERKHTSDCRGKVCSTILSELSNLPCSYASGYMVTCMNDPCFFQQVTASARPVPKGS